MNTYQHISPPDPEALAPKVREALTEYNSLKQAAQEADAALRTLTLTVGEAQQKDAQAAAVAIRAGKKQPGQKHHEAHLKRVQEAQHQSRAAHVAVELSGRDLRTAIESERDAQVATADERLAEAVEAWTAAVDALEAAAMASKGDYLAAVKADADTLTASADKLKGDATGDLLAAVDDMESAIVALTQATLAGAWIERFPKPVRSGPPSVPLPSANGENLTLVEVLAALRQLSPNAK